MPNGKMTNRDYIIEIHTDLKNLKEAFNSHKENHGDDLKEYKKNHKFMWTCIILIPPAIFYILEIIKGVIK